MQALSSYLGGSGGYDPAGPNQPGASPGALNAGVLGQTGMFNQPGAMQNIGSVIQQLLTAAHGPQVAAMGNLLGLPGSDTFQGHVKPVLDFGGQNAQVGGVGKPKGVLSGRFSGGGSQGAATSG